MMNKSCCVSVSFISKVFYGKEKEESFTYSRRHFTQQGFFVCLLNSALGKDLVFSKEIFHQEESYCFDSKHRRRTRGWVP